MNEAITAYGILVETMDPTTPTDYTSSFSLQLPSSSNQTQNCATYADTYSAGVTQGLKTVVATEQMTIVVNQGADSLTYWVPNYNITESDSYTVTAGTLEYPSWVTPYITVDNQMDANSIYYNTFNFTFVGT